MSDARICDICGYIGDPWATRKIHRFYQTVFFGGQKTEFDICDECLNEIRYRIDEKENQKNE